MADPWGGGGAIAPVAAGCRQTAPPSVAIAPKPVDINEIALCKKIKNWVNFVALCYVQETKSFQLQGALPPDLHQGVCPWIPLGALPPDPRYRLALRALAMGSAPSNENLWIHRCKIQHSINHCPCDLELSQIHSHGGAS